jgi:hypothetical protein
LIKAKKILLIRVPGPHVFGPPGSASGSVIYFYGSGSFYQQQKNEEFLSLKNDVNIYAFKKE